MSEGKNYTTVGKLAAFCLVLVFDPSLNAFKSLQTGRLIEQPLPFRERTGCSDLTDITQENRKNINIGLQKGRFSQVCWRDILFFVVWIVSMSRTKLSIILWASKGFTANFYLETKEEAI